MGCPKARIRGRGDRADAPAARQGSAGRCVRSASFTPFFRGGSIAGPSGTCERQFQPHVIVWMAVFPLDNWIFLPEVDGMDQHDVG